MEQVAYISPFDGFGEERSKRSCYLFLVDGLTVGYFE